MADYVGFRESLSKSYYDPGQSFVLVALPPDVREVCEPSGGRHSYQGYAPKSWVQPKLIRQSNGGPSRHRTLSGQAAKTEVRVWEFFPGLHALAG
jgi:hypothetical protein